ncbi:MAG: glutathione S-transferase family protein [Pseudobdellovibrionaceae bacterium]
MKPIHFFHNPMSRGRIVHWMLEEVGVPYEVTLIDFDKKEHKSPKFLALNPMGKIPTIIHGDTVVTEAAAICTYLADLFPEKNLAPNVTDPSRGTYIRWMFFGAGCIESAITDRLYPRSAPNQPGSLGYGSYDDTVAALEKALAPGPFILGNTFSAVDVYVGSQIMWGMMVKALEPKPVFKKYVELCMERPALKRVFEQSAEMTKRLEDGRSLAL